MEYCKPCATPCVPKKKIDEASTDISYATFPYREAVGSLLYLSLTHSRLECWAALWLHQVLRMLSLSSDKCAIVLERLIMALCFVELESRHSLHTRTPTGAVTSTTNRLLALHFVGYDFVHWTSKKQGCVAFSTAEAEYVAASSCVQDVVWLRGVLFALNFQHTGSAVIFEDNTAVIKCSAGGSSHAKHIDLIVCFVHAVVSMKQAILKYLPTA
jgi:hypothetical protein